MKRNKQLLAFDQLEAEMEVISKEMQVTFKGGSSNGGGSFGGPNQCFFDAMSYLARTMAGYGNPGYDSDYFFAQYVSTYGSSGLSYGSSGFEGIALNNQIAGDLLQEFIGLSGTALTTGGGVSNHLSNGGVVLTTLKTTMPSGQGGHAVLITGSNGGDWTVFDTTTNTSYTVTNDDIDATVLLGL